MQWEANTLERVTEEGMSPPAAVTTLYLMCGL